MGFRQAPVLKIATKICDLNTTNRRRTCIFLQCCDFSVTHHWLSLALVLLITCSVVQFVVNVTDVAPVHFQSLHHTPHTHTHTHTHTHMHTHNLLLVKLTQAGSLSPGFFLSLHSFSNTHTPAHTHTHTHTLSLCLTHSPTRTHTHLFHPDQSQDNELTERDHTEDALVFQCSDNPPTVSLNYQSFHP